MAHVRLIDKDPREGKLGEEITTSEAPSSEVPLGSSKLVSFGVISLVATLRLTHKKHVENP